MGSGTGRLCLHRERKVGIKVVELCRCKSRLTRICQSANASSLTERYLALFRSASLISRTHVHVCACVCIYISFHPPHAIFPSSPVAKIQAKRQNPVSTIHIRLKHIKWACSGAQSKHTASSFLSVYRVHVGPRH